MSLVCDENLGSRDLDGQVKHRGQPLAAIVAGERDLLLLEARGSSRRSRSPGASGAPRKPARMGAAVALQDVVGEAQHRLVVASRSTTAPPRRRPAVARSVLMTIGFGTSGDLVAGRRYLTERLDAALVASSPRASRPRSCGAGRRARWRTPELRKASSRRRCSVVAQSNSVIVKVAARGIAGTSPRCRGFAAGVADDRERRLGVAVGELHEVFLGHVAPDCELEPA